MLTQSPIYLGLLQEVLEKKEEDWPRLVLADWLEDHGDPQRAEFIRCQVALASEPDRECGGFSWHKEGCDRLKCNRARIQRAREKALFNWDNITRWGWRSGCWERTTVDRAEFDGFAQDAGIVLVRRGFPSRVRSPLSSWEKYGPSLVRQHPLERVEASDKKPHCYNREEVRHAWYAMTEAQEATWSGQDVLEQDDIPGRLVRIGGEGIYFQSEEEAVDWLSRRLLLWARGQAPSNPQP